MEDMDNNNDFAEYERNHTRYGWYKEEEEEEEEEEVLDYQKLWIEYDKMFNN